MLSSHCFMICINVLCYVLICYGPLCNSSPLEFKGQLLFVVRHFYSCNKFVHCQVIGAFNYCLDLRSDTIHLQSYGLSQSEA